MNGGGGCLLHRAPWNWQNHMCLFLFSLPRICKHTHTHTFIFGWPFPLYHWCFNFNVVSYEKWLLTSRRLDSSLWLFVLKEHCAFFVLVLTIISHRCWWKYLFTPQTVSLKRVHRRFLSFWIQCLGLLSHPHFSISSLLALHSYLLNDAWQRIKA